MLTISINNISITPEMLSIISRIDSFNASWKYMAGMEPERLKSLRKVATIESIGSSNRIEGNRLSDRDVEALLSRVGAESFATRDEQEVVGYARLMDELYDNFEILPLTENYIKQFHQILLSWSDKDMRHRGEYKNVSNSVMAYGSDGEELGVVFETSSPFETPEQMRYLVRWMNEAREEDLLHPLLLIGIFIVHFLAIHPFQDGNGRLSRALNALLLLKAGYSYIPYTSLETIIEESKEAYYRSLHQTQVSFKKEHPDYAPWLTFFLRSLLKQKQRLEQKISVKYTANLTPKELRIMDLFSNKPQWALREIVQATAMNINTAKKSLKSLVEKQNLALEGKGRNASYKQYVP